MKGVSLLHNTAASTLPVPQHPLSATLNPDKSLVLAFMYEREKKMLFVSYDYRISKSLS